MTTIVKPPWYDYCGLSISQYTIMSIYCPSLSGSHVWISPPMLPRQLDVLQDCYALSVPPITGVLFDGINWADCQMLPECKHIYTWHWPTHPHPWRSSSVWVSPFLLGNDRMQHPIEVWTVQHWTAEGHNHTMDFNLWTLICQGVDNEIRTIKVPKRNTKDT